MTCETPGAAPSRWLPWSSSTCPGRYVASVPADAEVWMILTAPDLDARPHHLRECAVCGAERRAPGRAVCPSCIPAAYVVSASGSHATRGAMRVQPTGAARRRLLAAIEGDPQAAPILATVWGAVALLDVARGWADRHDVVLAAADLADCAPDSLRK